MTKLIKLNLGCGKHILRGYINIDKVKTHKRVIVADIRHLGYEPDTIYEIFMRHVIEHFYEDEIKQLLTDCRRMLRIDGKLIIETVDFDKIIEAWQMRKLPKGLVNRFLFGFYAYEGTREREPYMMHKYVFDHELLREFLIDAGFKTVHYYPTPKPFNYDPKYGDFFTGMRVEARKW
jgi:predicted SAM-dependent methyltransferase